VVDVLSFTSTVVTAVAHGATVYPCTTHDEAVATAVRVGGDVAVHRRDAPAAGRFSLSPLSFVQAVPGDRVAIASPNGATCCRLAQDVPALFAGALLNAEAVAQAIERERISHCCAVTVLACGERWLESNEDGDLRFGIEDYLGAGAVIAALPDEGKRSPEAFLAQAAFAEAQHTLLSLLQECGSGRELQAKGFGGDVAHAAQLNRYAIAPIFDNKDNFFSPASGFNHS
jgi:2-phosphosulfolactate phosphatase